MWQVIRENPRAVLYAVLMHIGLLVLLEQAGITGVGLVTESPEASQ